MISDITTGINSAPLIWGLRKENNETTAQFQRLLANETWQPIFKNWDTNYKFSSLVDRFLKFAEASFPVQNKSLGKTRNDWITQGINISCRHKRSQYNLNRSSKNPHMTAHYSKYCKILFRVIKEAKSTIVGL
jgi:hypothetical protein